MQNEIGTLYPKHASFLYCNKFHILYNKTPFKNGFRIKGVQLHITGKLKKHVLKPYLDIISQIFVILFTMLLHNSNTLRGANPWRYRDTAHYV